MQNRSRLSLWNALSALILTMINGLLGIVVMWFVIAKYGSDFNGLNSAVNQIVNVLLVLDGGFTLASNVALFEPLTRQDYMVANGLLAATRKQFRLIGAIFLILGMLVSVVYGSVVNSRLSREFIITVVLMAVAPAAFNLFYSTAYRVLLQAQQKEYIINLITAFTIGMGHVVNIVMIQRGGSMWLVRFNSMIFALLNSFILVGFVKRRNFFLDLRVEPRKDLIIGSGDALAQKITGLVYGSAPIVFLSVSPISGTLLVSVYGVYNSVFVMLKCLLRSIIDAPRLGFGQLLTEREREDVWPVYAQYEYMAFSAIFILLTTCHVLLLPFIEFYTAGVYDVDYCDAMIALLMSLIAVVEMAHIPSGHLINMAGKFRISRNIQVVCCAILLITMPFSGGIWGVYGMLGAILAVVVMLALLEMGYVHLLFFREKAGELLRMLLPLIAVGVPLCRFEEGFRNLFNGYVSFVLCGCVLIVMNGIILVLVSLVFNRRMFQALWCRGVALLRL